MCSACSSAPPSVGCETLQNAAEGIGEQSATRQSGAPSRRATRRVTGRLSRPKAGCQLECLPEPSTTISASATTEGIVGSRLLGSEGALPLDAFASGARYLLSIDIPPPNGSKWGNSIPSNFAYSGLVCDLTFLWKQNRLPDLNS